MKSFWTALILMPLFGAIIARSQPDHWESCPTIASLPTGPSSTLSEPPASVERFELHMCEGNAITVCAFKHREREPALTFNTGDGYPRYMLHVFNLLILQSMGGASDHVYVFAFHHGVPSVEWRTATKDLIQATQSKDGVAVSVPAVTYQEHGKWPPKRPATVRSFMIE